MAKYIILFIILLSNMLFVNTAIAQDDLVLNLVHTYSFERGYRITWLDANTHKVILIFATLNKIDIVNTKTGEIKTIKYSIGKGPGEILRGPNGISFTKNSLYLWDPAMLRFSVYDRSNHIFKTKLYNDKPLLIIWDLKGVDLLAKPRQISKLAYLVYDPIDNKIIKKYYLPENPRKTGNIFRYSGWPAVTKHYIIQADKYYGDMLIWNRQSTKLIKMRSVEKIAGKLDTTNVILNGKTGIAPPRNPKLYIHLITANPLKESEVFLLMKSRDGNYNYHWIYDYDFLKGRMVGKARLEAKADWISTNNTDLFVYSNKKGKLYHYKIKCP